MTSLQNTQYSLYNLENYKSSISNSFEDIIKIYDMLIAEYGKVNKKHPQNFIISRGLDTISHVFIMMLFYSKNLNMSYYHSQKAFYYYIEFIEQITGDTNCLQLSSKDAMMFVYKKTIFEINQTYVHPIQEQDTQKMEELNKYILNIKQEYNKKKEKDD